MHRLRYPRATIVARGFIFSLCVGSLSVTAQTALEEVVVTARRMAAPGTASVALSSRSLRDASEAAPMVPADLFRGMPGAFVQQTTPGQGIPIVRGLKGSQVLHLVDGFRLNNAFYRSAPNQYMGLVPTVGLSRVEVARGAVATLYGSDAMGGLVQLVSEVPDYNRALTPFGGVSWLSSSEAVQASAGIAWGNSDNAVRLGVQWSDVGDRSTGGGDTIEPSAYESSGLNFMFRHALAGGGEWRLGVQHMRQPRTPRVDELVPGYGQTTPSSAIFEFAPNERDFVNLVVEPALDTFWADEARFQVGWQRVVDDRRNQDFGSPEITTEQNRSDLFAASAVFGRAWSATQRTRYGLDVTTDEVRSARQSAIGEERPVDVPARFPDGSRLDSIGLFATHHWSLTPSTDLELGGRYSRYRIELAETLAAPGTRLQPDNLTWQLGLRRGLSESLDLLVNLGEGYRVPNVFDLGTLGPRPGNRFNVANTDLGPETLFSSDVGLRWQRGSTHVELFLFRLDYEDRITSLETGEVTDTGRLVVISDNVGQSRLHGVEFSLGTRFSEDWTLDAAVNWTRGEDDALDGTTTPGDRIPPLNGRVALAWSAAPAWSARAVLQFAAAQDRLSPRDVSDPRIDPGGTDGWATLNLRVDRPLGARWYLTLGLENVFDAHYREHGSGLDAPGRGVVVSIESRLL